MRFKNISGSTKHVVKRRVKRPVKPGEVINLEQADVLHSSSALRFFESLDNRPEDKKVKVKKQKEAPVKKEEPKEENVDESTTDAQEETPAEEPVEEKVEATEPVEEKVDEKIEAPEDTVAPDTEGNKEQPDATGEAKDPGEAEEVVEPEVTEAPEEENKEIE